MSVPSFFSFFWTFYRPYKIHLCFFSVCAVLIGMQSVVHSYVIKLLVDEISRGHFEIIWPAFLCIGYLELFNGAWRGIHWMKMRIAPEVKNLMLAKTLSQIHQQRYRFLQENLSGKLVSSVNFLVENIENITTNLSTFLIRGATQLVISVIAMFAIHPIFSVSLLIWSFIFIMVSIPLSRKVATYSQEYAKSHSGVLGHLADSISNTSLVKLFVGEEFEYRQLEEPLAKFKDAYLAKERYLMKFYYFQGLMVTLLMGSMIGELYLLREVVTPGDFALILGIAYAVSQNIWTTMEKVDLVHEGIGKCQQALHQIFCDVEESPVAFPLQIKAGGVDFEGISFSYPNRNIILRDVNLKIAPGETVGIVGDTGSGKTTLAKLLLGFYELNSGRILIDGQDISMGTKKSLRNGISVIPQEPVLFHRTIMENIRYGNEYATDHEVMEAAKKAHIHASIQQLPQGYQSVVGEQGTKLSGGERQRIAVARAILKDAPILILDEATSQLDTITENLIRQSIQEFSQHKTTLIIAHRLSNLLFVDRIVVLKNGTIVEEGTREQLFSLRGVYYELCRAQKEESPLVLT